MFLEKIESGERCKGVYFVDLGESFPTHIYLQNLASIQPSPVYRRRRRRERALQPSVHWHFFRYFDFDWIPYFEPSRLILTKLRSLPLPSADRASAATAAREADGPKHIIREHQRCWQILANFGKFVSLSAVSAPIFVVKYTFCSIF